MRVILFGLGLCVLAACESQNAILEVELSLPPQQEEALFAQVQFRPAENHPFDIKWEGEDLDSFPLASETLTVNLSVISEEPPDLVHTKIRFCASTSCTALEDDRAPELWFALEQPLYLGERTRWKQSVPQVPSETSSEAQIIDKCEIVGCVSGEASFYCRLDGSHFCE